MSFIDVDAKGAASKLVDEETAKLPEQLAALDPKLKEWADYVLDGLDKRLRAILADAAKGLVK